MVETQTQLIKNDELLNNVACFVLLENSNERQPFFVCDLLGKPVFEWVTQACPTIPVTIECGSNDSVVEIIRPYLKSAEFTLVLYGDTPLLSKLTINNILEYISREDINVCTLERGYVFRTDYIRRVEDIYGAVKYPYFSDEFKQMNSLEVLDQTRQMLKERILNFHINNGVTILDKSLSYIEGDVGIAEGVVIEPYVRLGGQTQVFENVKISSGANIVSSKIGANSNIGKAVIINSTIKENCRIEDGANISDGSFIGSSSIIGKNSIIENSSIAPGGQINMFSSVISAKIYPGAVVGSYSLVAGDKECPIRVAQNEIVEPYQIRRQTKEEK